MPGLNDRDLIAETKNDTFLNANSVAYIEISRTVHGGEQATNSEITSVVPKECFTIVDYLFCSGYALPDY